MAAVRVHRRDMVVPATPTERASMFLSCLDIFWQDVHYNERLIFYEAAAMAALAVNGRQREDGDAAAAPAGLADETAAAAATVMEKLKSSLALCLVHYYPWCGRIAKGAEPPHRVFIDCCDAGVEFVEASSSLPLARLARNGFQMSPLFEQLCQHPDHRGTSLFSSPLLSIQATLFSDGGLAIGVAQSHIVADGQSLWQFMVSWGECARGIPLTMAPFHDREKLRLPNPPPMAADSNLHYEVKPEDICEDDELAENSPSFNKDTGSPCKGSCSPLDGDSSGVLGCKPCIKIVPVVDFNVAHDVGTDSLVLGTDSLVQCVVNLTDSAIKNLKHEVHGSYTSYEVICAHFWQRVTIARGGSQNEPAFFTVFANCRNRLSTPLPPSYFGNVIMFAVASGTVGKVSSENLTTIADRIHSAIVTCHENSLMAFMHWLELHDNHAAFAFQPTGQMVFMASSPRFPIYQVDFGWGRPMCVRSVRVHGDGELVIFGGHSRLARGGVEICLALPSKVMRRLLEDPQFLGELPLASSEISSN